MDSKTANILNLLNRRFYSDLGGSFSATRNKAQPGVQKLSAMVPSKAAVLDIGCGNGTFAAQLALTGFHGEYVGIDFSIPMLGDAMLRDLPFKTNFIEFDIYESDLTQIINQSFDLISLFAVLHHLPGEHARRKVFQFVHSHLQPDGSFLISNWQFLNSEKLRSRILPWDIAGIDQDTVDENDYLLDWKSGGSGIRYAHSFTQAELNRIALEEGFQVISNFLSDGKSGDLGLYNVWQLA